MIKVHVDAPTREELLAALKRVVSWQRTELPADASGPDLAIQRLGHEIAVFEDRLEPLIASLDAITADPQLSDGQRIARLMIEIADSQAIEPLDADAEGAAQESLDVAALLVVSVLTCSRSDQGVRQGIGILEQGSADVFLYYLSQRALPTRERSLARMCEDTLNRIRRAGATHRAAPRVRPKSGGSPICGIGTPVTRVTDVEQAESLRHAEPVERAILDADWLPDVPGRDIVPSMIGLAHAEEREEESESTLMSYAAFVGVDGDRCALGMGYAVSRLELWGAPTLIFGSYPAADGLARVYPGSMNGRWNRPMLDDPAYLYSATEEFLREKRPAILARAELLTAVAAADSGPLKDLHEEILDADPFAFDATALTHRRATFLTASNLHWAHAQPHELAALRELGLRPVPRWPGDQLGSLTLPRRESGGRLDSTAFRPQDAQGAGRAGRMTVDAASLQTLRAFAKVRELSPAQAFQLLEAAFEPGLALSRSSGTINFLDWARIAQTLGFED